MITRDQLIDHIMNMHNGIGQDTPQPEYADYMTGRYDACLPWLQIAQAAKEAKAALKAAQ